MREHTFLFVYLVSYLDDSPEHFFMCSEGDCRILVSLHISP